MRSLPLPISSLVTRVARTPASTAALALALSTACVPTAPITVVHVGKRPNVDTTAGDPVKLRQPSPDTYAGIRGGAYVVRSAEDWSNAWKGKTEPPAFPPTLDPTREMLVLVATDDAIVSRLKVTRAIETGELVTFFVRQTMLGEGCVRKMSERIGVDAVVVPRIDKPVKFYIEDEDGASCGPPPKADVTCRVGAAKSWSSNLTAKAGDVVECELSSIATGKYELVDQTLSLVDSPPGSNAKLAFSKGGARATLALDSFGTFAVRAEATDEAGRRGRATAHIEVVPKKTRDVLVQLTWSDADPADLTAPLPRVLLRVAQEGPQGQRCSSEVPVPGLCDAKTRGAYTYMKIPASRRKLPLSLLYLDERAQAGASPCVSVWFNGERTVATCDKDHRQAEDRWELGTLDTSTGKLTPPKPVAVPVAASAGETPPPVANGSPASTSSKATSKQPAR